MLFPIKACAISHLGHHRQNQEDNFLLNDGQYISEDEQKLFSIDKHFFVRKSFYGNCDRAIFAVSDGMGGHQAGEVASMLAITNLNKEKDYILDVNQIEGSIERFQSHASKMNHEICNEAKKNSLLSGMGATLTSLIFFHGNVIGMNVGDSRIYQYNGEKLLQITRDHTVGQRLLDLKILAAEEVNKLDTRKALTRYLGMNEEGAKFMCGITGKFTVHQREWFLLCSDGLSDALPESNIEILMNPFFYNGNVQEAVHALVKAVLDGVGEKSGGNDNVTTMIIEIQGSSM